MKTNYEHYKELIIKGQYNHCEVYEELMGMECHCMGCDDHCFTKVIEWLNQPYQEPIQVTLFEKSILECAVNRGYKWIARDEYELNEELNIFSIKPYKDTGYWNSKGDSCDCWLFDNLFQFIQWEDEEPYYIPTLLKECEVVE